MARKQKPLTALQQEALKLAEDTLFGDVKIIDGFGRSIPGLRKRGLVDGVFPHIYLTQAGKELVQQ